LEAEFTLEAKDRNLIEKTISEIIEKRKSQPIGHSVAVFLSIQTPIAGALIEQCGLKGVVVGGANNLRGSCQFLLSTQGEAQAVDVVALIDRARGLVRENFGIDLKKKLLE
jgi:UDP-N-acetylmuramate dehydrogenase